MGDEGAHHASSVYESSSASGVEPMGSASTRPTFPALRPELPPLPPFVEWRFGEAGNTTHRLQLVGFNFYRALCRLATCGPHAVLRESRLTVGGANESNDLGPLWVVSARGEEVVGPSISGCEWELLGRFRHTPATMLQGPSPLERRVVTFVWSVFPRANAHRGRWDDSALIRYVRCYLDVATRTAVAMMDAAADELPRSDSLNTALTCCIFNPAGAGAFLRGVGQPLEAELSRLIPCMIAAAFIRAQRLRPLVSASLFLAGVRQKEQSGHANYPTARTLLSVPRDSASLLRAATGGEDLSELFSGCSTGECILPLNASAAMVDMLCAARALLSHEPLARVAVSMAGDSRRLGNAFLGLRPHNGLTVSVADPYNSARRASDENNTRRTTMMEVALAFGALGCGSPTMVAYGQPLEHAASAAALRNAILDLEAAHVSASDRSAIVDAHQLAPFFRACGNKRPRPAADQRRPSRAHCPHHAPHARAPHTANQLDICLADMHAFEMALRGGGNVNDRINVLLHMNGQHAPRQFTNLPWPICPVGGGGCGRR